MARVPDKKAFSKKFDDLQEVIDVDDSRGRSVPINMNFIEEGFLTKDVGFSLLGNSEENLCHSLFLYEKKNGDEYLIRAIDTQLQYYSFIDKVWYRLGTTDYTVEAEFGFVVYDDELFGCNGVENYFKFDGTTFTEYATAPKGNILEVFEDRMFVSGVDDEPLTLYYSKVGDATDWTTTTNVLKPLGTDFVTNMKNYYGVLMVFKEGSIWKVTFVYDQTASAFLPKLEQQSGNYGSVSKKGVTWVENDLWFFNGREVRAIGFADYQSGVFGINKSVISEPIKETLTYIDKDNYGKCVVGYHNRRFYLSVPMDDETTDTTFVCHLLYKNNWTKYTGRDKAKIKDFAVVDKIIYTTVSSVNFGVLKWEVESSDSTTLQRKLEVNI